MNAAEAVLPEIARQFAVPGDFVAATPFAGGHINESYMLEIAGRAGLTRYFLQRLNGHVFPDADAVMENIERVTRHIGLKMRERGGADADRRALRLILTHDGATYMRDAAGDAWRLFDFVARTRVRLTAQTPEQAEQAARAFGEFQALLVDLPGPRLNEVIPGFHDTPRRLEQLEAACAAATEDGRLRARVGEAEPELAFIRARGGLAGELQQALAAGELALRIVHNDAKISNVLLDEQTGAALCVADLDTVMPGPAVIDFGDMVRSMVAAADEDEPDAARVVIREAFFEALARGYCEATRDFLTRGERALLVTAGLVVSLEQAARFLADFLRGDVYYKTTRPGQNLERARVQLQIVRGLETARSRLERSVQDV